MPLKEREKYNNISIPSIEKIIKSELYNSMIKFDINDSPKVGNNRTLFIPDDIIDQYLDNNQTSERKNEISGLMLWHSRRGLITRIILIPEFNCNLLIDMHDKSKEFMDYFEEKDPIILKNYYDIAYRLQDIDGKFSKFRHAGTRMKYYANNGIYVLMEKILPPR